MRRETFGRPYFNLITLQHPADTSRKKASVISQSNLSASGPVLHWRDTGMLLRVAVRLLIRSHTRLRGGSFCDTASVMKKLCGWELRYTAPPAQRQEATMLPYAVWFDPVERLKD